jgi:hypothetical protein
MGIETMSTEQMARLECLVNHLGGISECDSKLD